MKRIYSSVIENHLRKYSQMVFISGPRQVGKTTIAQSLNQQGVSAQYLNWDSLPNRKKMLQLFEETAPILCRERKLASQNFLILDEFHKFKNWKNYIKGFYDTCRNEFKIILTGSSRLNTYRKGGDSLMGRYFNYTVHPLSLGEILRPTLSNTSDVQSPIKCDPGVFESLLKFGGYPEPFLKQEAAFHTMWQSSRFQQLFREEIRDIEDIKNVGQLELLAHILQNQASGAVNYSTLASKIQVDNKTIKKWINLLETFYFCFTLKPWRTNLSRALIKEPKIYLWDWSAIESPGARFENLVLSHLAKSISLWNETGLGAYDLFYIRTKEKKEVDFLVTKNNSPWILVETKHSENNSISKNLIYFKEKIGAQHAFQVTADLPYVDKNCFEEHEPIMVPATTFLSQLV